MSGVGSNKIWVNALEVQLEGGDCLPCGGNHVGSCDGRPCVVLEDITYEVQGVYGVYDIVLKLTSDDAEKLRGIITNKVRKIAKVQSTLTMMVIEEQENL